MIIRDVTIEDVSELTVELLNEGDAVAIETPHGSIVVYIQNNMTMINEDLHG